MSRRMSAAGPSQGAHCAPLGGSAAATAASVGVLMRAAGPSQGAHCAPLGGSAAATAASVGVQLPRHTLVWPTSAGWTRIRCDDTADEACAAYAQWFTRDWPLVVRRPHADERCDATELALGLPLPPAQGKRRLNIRLAASDVARHSTPLALAHVVHALPREWQRAVSSLLHDAGASRIRFQVFGSAAWQAITGLVYMHDASDLDLLFHPRQADEIDAMLALLDCWERTHALRADGEIVFPDGAAVSWREWRNAPQAAQVLVKHLDYATLLPRIDVLRRLSDPVAA
jgi:phosphoribosyl-dephospho-CoA transferase